uniref:Uncharacterized protein n=1 Tax=Peronospora matthiolae TaxID=2874970 RepID=A0AAV1UDS6_9STRA
MSLSVYGHGREVSLLRWESFSWPKTTASLKQRERERERRGVFVPRFLQLFGRDTLWHCEVAGTFRLPSATPSRRAMVRREECSVEAWKGCRYFLLETEREQGVRGLMN